MGMPLFAALGLSYQWMRHFQTQNVLSNSGYPMRLSIVRANGNKKASVLLVWAYIKVNHTAHYKCRVAREFLTTKSVKRIQSEGLSFLVVPESASLNLSIALQKS